MLIRVVSSQIILFYIRFFYFYFQVILLSKTLDALALDGMVTDEQKIEYKRQLKLKETETKRAMALCEELAMSPEDRSVQKNRE